MARSGCSLDKSAYRNRREPNRPVWGFLNHFENNSPDYLLRVVALTNATEMGDGYYLLNVGTNRFHVRDKYVRRIREVKDAKLHYEETCFFVVNPGMPSAEQIATALLMLKNEPTLFDKCPLRMESHSRLTARFLIESSMKTRIDRPDERAAMYLKRIVVLTGAKRVCGDMYFLKAGGKRFLLDDEAVRLVSHGGRSTCFSIPTRPHMPRQEVIASALLQLKNNPKLFKKWRKQPGYLFRANGKKFRTDELLI